MIQNRAVQSQADAHRRDLMASAGPRRASRGQAAGNESAADAALGHRTPGARWPSSASGRGATPRGLADRVRDEARRGDDPYVLSPAGPVAPPSDRPAGFGLRDAIGKSGEWRRHATSSSSRSTSGAATASPPSAIRSSRPRLSTPWQAGASSFPTTGPTPPRADLRGPASTRAPTSTAIAPSSTGPRWTPGSPTWRCWPARRATTRCSSGTRTPRSIRGRSRPVTPGCSATRGSCPDSAPSSRTRGRRGARPGGGGSRRRASTSRRTRIDLYEPIEGFPGADAHGSTWAPARFPVELSQTSFVRQSVIEWLEQNGDTPFFVHASFIRPHPPRRNPIGYHDLYPAEAVGPFVGCATPEEEGAIHPLGAFAMATPEVGASRDERERRQVRATYYGAQREVDDGLAPLFDYLTQQWAGRVHPGGAHQRPRRDGR